MPFKPMLDNRDISILVWLAVFSLWAGSKAEVRKAAANVVRAALTWKLLLPIWLIAGYVALAVYLLQRFDLWDFTDLKTTVLWFFSAGLVMVFEVASTQQDDHYFRKAVLDGFKISIVLEFIVNLYVLILPFELLLIPTATVLAVTLVMAESKEEFKPVRTFLNSVSALLGLGLLSYAAYQIYRHVQAFASVSTLAQFLLPIGLTTVFIPCLYLLATYVSYDNLFRRLQFFMQDPRLRRFTKVQLLLRLNLNFPVERGTRHITLTSVTG